MKVTGLDHVGIAVADMERALGFYRDTLGLVVVDDESRPELGIRIVRLQCRDGQASEMPIELIEARDWQRTAQRHRSAQGPGAYHFALRVDDVATALAERPAIDREPRIGRTMLAGFLEPHDELLVELVERR